MLKLPDFHELTFAVIDRDGHPWLTSSDLAKALGYTRPDAISRLYERNATEFTEAMTAILRVDQPQIGRAHRQSDGVPPSTGHSDTRIFSLRGAHLVAMFAKTPVAAEFRRWVLDVLDGMARPATKETDFKLKMLRDLGQFLDGKDVVTIAEVRSHLSLAAEGGGFAAELLRIHGWKRAWVRGKRGPIPALRHIIAGDDQ